MRNAIAKAYALGIITGSFLSAGIFFAVPSKADPDNATIAYTATYGSIVCQVLDAYPSEAGILGIGDAIAQDGLTYKQAGYVIALAVGEICPRHTALIAQFARNHAGNQLA